MVVCGDIRLRLHRIGLAHWRPQTRLRSWGVAPLHRVDDTLLAPCGPGEALWLGAWPDDDQASATARLQDTALPAGAEIALPAEFQLTGLHDGTGRATPLTLAAGQPRRALRLELDGASPCTLQLALLPPAAWSRSAGRSAPGPLAGPPPPPPRLG